MEKYLNVLFLTVAFISTGICIANTNENYYEIVRNMGYEDVNSTPEEIVELIIPMEFNNVYKRYNSLQKEGGYDLSFYKGKKCTRYTYLIPSVNARANIIVYNGNIIGGDISGITIDGIMIPLLAGCMRNHCSYETV